MIPVACSLQLQVEGLRSRWQGKPELCVNLAQNEQAIKTPCKLSKYSHCGSLHAMRPTSQSHNTHHECVLCLASAVPHCLGFMECSGRLQESFTILSINMHPLATDRWNLGLRVCHHVRNSTETVCLCHVIIRHEYQLIPENRE